MPKNLFFFIALFFCQSSNSFAWGELGHEIIGAAAEERMDPETKAFVAGILGVEPTCVSSFLHENSSKIIVFDLLWERTAHSELCAGQKAVVSGSDDL